MAVEDVYASDVPVPEKALRDLAKDVGRCLPNLAEKDPTIGVKEFYAVIDRVLETADIPDLDSGHRAAASNALCAIVDHCQAFGSEHIHSAVLGDSVWLKIFDIYLHRSGEAKGKSMRQILVTLTNAIVKGESPRALDLRKQAAGTFLDIICERQDRFKVKPALQGLAHFLLKKVVSIAQLVQIYQEQTASSPKVSIKTANPQALLTVFLGWVVHHETALSAGHLVRNFLNEARQLPNYSTSADSNTMLPLWIGPVIQTLKDWPDRILEFKTHVFPHCFLPNIEEYLDFLSVLDFAAHIQSRGPLPLQLTTTQNHQQTIGKAQEFRIFLAAIESGKELSLIRDMDSKICSNIEVKNGSLFMPDSIFGDWMSHAEPEVRLAGMFLSIYSVSITKPMSHAVLKALQQNLVHLHADTDPFFRREVLGNTQRLFDRLRACTATAAKAKAKAATGSHIKIPISWSYYEPKDALCKRLRQDPDLAALLFVAWYLRFLEGELRPTASYQRRITALRAFVIVLRSGLDPGVPQPELSKSAQGQLNWAHGIQIASPRLIRVLLDLILDAFDDVRDTAVSVLQLCLIALPQGQSEEILNAIPKFLKRAEATMLLTGRADQADGVARIYGMIFSLANCSFEKIGYPHFASRFHVFKHLNLQLRETLGLAHRNLSDAVDGRPVHGTFAALAYIIDQPNFYSDLLGAPQATTEQWRRLHDETIASIESLWLCVHHVLCADAPEGHVPDEIEEEASLDTKEILSYSWRGLKEASNLLRIIATKAPVGTSDRDCLTPKIFERLGYLCFTQLLELRHRGAFSTVSQTFATFCRRCIISKIDTLQTLPEAWYQETLRSIQDKADAITRRSAGIPALMTSLLAAEAQLGGTLFPRAMHDLIAETLVEAESANIEESRLPQVHALNCIKEIFTTSRLSVVSEAYIGKGLELAAKTLNSDIWPIRNCSLMLFKALIERLLGSDEAQDWKERERAKTSRFSYDFFPSLPQMLSDLLDPNGPLKKSMDSTKVSGSPFDLHGAEGVFPALQILRQARPPQNHLHTIQIAVKSLLSSPHWHLRDMAARTDVSLCTISQLHNAACSRLSTVPKSANEQHGVLLTIRYIYIRLLRDVREFATVQFGMLMEELGDRAHDWYTTSDCPFVRSAFLDVIAVCGMTMLRRPDTLSVLHAWQELAESVSIGPQHVLNVSNRPEEPLLQKSLAQVFFIDRVIMRDGSLEILTCEEYQGIEEALMLLAANDPDTCLAALETLDRITRIKPYNGVAVPIIMVLVSIHKAIVHATNPEVVSSAQAILAFALEDKHLRTDFFNTLTKSQTSTTIDKLESQCLDGPPSTMQSALHLLGIFLDHAYKELTESRTTVLHSIARYIRLLRMTILETNPFDMRFAAAQSLSTLSHIWTADPTSRPTSSLLLALSLILYDLLSDDDDEIRALAARTTHTFLTAQQPTRHRSPAPALPSSLTLIFHLLASTPPFPHLLSAALRRLTATTSLITPFAPILSHARKPDSALFATEKQNLYYDPTLDARIWTALLSTLPVPRAVSAQVATWVLRGLEVLIGVAKEERDGALGWTSKGEVFALVERVLGAAEVVVRWRDTERTEVLGRLVELLEVGRGRGDLHGLLMRRVENILEREVVGLLGRVKGSLPRVCEECI